MNTNIETEVLVLGAGPAGYSAAFRCADLGLNTTLINKYKSLGGVCLNVGCIPSKTLLHFSKIIDDVNKLKNHGLTFNNLKFDINKIKIWKNNIISQLSNSLFNMSQKRKVKVINGVGTFKNKNEIIVKNSENNTVNIKFKYAIIASGSRNVKTALLNKTNDRIMYSTDALNINYIPNKLLIIGGGIIGLELGTIYQSLGSKIDIVEHLDQIIIQADKDIINNFVQGVKDKFNFLLKTEVIKIDINNKNQDFDVFLKKNNSIQKFCYDAILVAIGRIPNSDSSNINCLKIKKDEKNFIVVDKQMRTNISNIFAIGDVVGQPMLAHKATHQAHIAAEVISGKKHFFDTKTIPYVAYTNPEISWVGITEKEAKKEKISFETSIFPWKASGRAIASNCTLGMTKLIFDKNTHRIIGGSVLGSNAGELIGEIGLAIEMGCCAEDISLTIHAHPTLNESIGLSAEIFTGVVTDIMNVKNTYF